MTTERGRRRELRVSPADDALMSSVARTGEVFAEYQVVELSREAFAQFVETLDDAPVTVPELVDVFSQPSRITEV